jgi:3-oxoacyl-[acyl-carrier-protein] synthase-3
MNAIRRKYTKILATGSYLPERVLSNEELAQRVNTSDEWIVDRTGIKNRRIASEAETTAKMGANAALRALEAANFSPQAVDMIVVATCTPDKVFPSTACLIQEALGIPPCPAFDIQAACSGFIYGLSVIDQFVNSGLAKNPLLIGSEVMSRLVDWQDRRTCILFGDGAGAILCGASDTPGILSTELGADGQHKDILYVDNKQNSYIQMQGSSVFRLAVGRLEQEATKSLKENNLTINNIDWLVPHQANIRIIQATAEKLGLSMDKVVITLNQHGNTSGASIPLALDTAVRDGRIQRDQHLMLEAFGGGLTWGTALIKY